MHDPADSGGTKSGFARKAIACTGPSASERAHRGPAHGSGGLSSVSSVQEFFAGPADDEGLSLGHVFWLRQCTTRIPLGVVPAWFAQDLVARGLLEDWQGASHVTAAGHRFLRRVLVRHHGSLRAGRGVQA